LIQHLARRFRRTVTLCPLGTDADALAASEPMALAERAECFLIAPPAPP